jgi:hypothetical protein
LAVLGVFNVMNALYIGDNALIWLDVFFVLFWVYMAKKALNRQLQPGEIDVMLTQEQKDRIREASQALNTAIREVEDECMAEATAMRLKARKEKDKENEDEV